MEDRLIELETKVAFQEDTIQKLSDVLADQQRQVYRMTKEMEAMKAKLSALAPSLLVGQDDEVPPPHY